ncbi:YVTN family beta-propeller protein [Dokdonella fugitiva]|uniref:YVTN family beta-propeller protein n=1 Tax=Dokdonella fugitiva TaxID=328517 RepID=A0A839EVS8_9GAMM|nr:beta-propeller fold lactonase family protein [Dokdonella fugitiva]MBA8888687.1 YVTN family beta-propeller protein [Dokdonella fugitiva]
MRNPTKALPKARALSFGLLAITSLPLAAAGPYAYVASNFDATASIVDLADTAATPMQLSVTTPRNPGFYGSALSGKDGMLYLSADFDEAVYQFNTTTRAFVRRIAVGDNPRGIAVDAGGRHVYVANFASTTLSVIDTTTQAVTDVGLPNYSGGFAKPLGVALNLAGTRAYVTDTSPGHRLCKVNTVALPDTTNDCVEVGENDSALPTAVAVSPDGARVYVVIHGSGSAVAVVDAVTMQVLRTIPLGFSSPNGIAISASGKRAYVGTTSGVISVLDLTRVSDAGQNPLIDTIDDPAVASVQGVSISPDGTRLLAVDSGNNVLHVVNIVGDADTIVASVPVNQGPYALGSFTAPDAIFVAGFEKTG